MKNSKAQSDVVTAILIVVVALGLVGTAFTWGLPLIQKRQDTGVVERISSFFDQKNANSLPSRIEFVANNGGEQTFSLDADGGWILHACPSNEIPSCNPSPDDIAKNEFNSIEFKFFSRVTNIASGAGFVSLTPGASCPPSEGILGQDKSSVVCAKAEATGDGYTITYKTYFRELAEAGSARGFKIDLTKHESSLYSSNGKSLKISRQGIEQVSSNGKTLIIPEIKILLE